MALLVTGDYVTPQGFTVPSVYWRWMGLAIDVSNMSATVTLYGYVDTAAFAAKKENIAQKQINLSGMDFGAMAVLPGDPGQRRPQFDHLHQAEGRLPGVCLRHRRVITSRR